MEGLAMGRAGLARLREHASRRVVGVLTLVAVVYAALPGSALAYPFNPPVTSSAGGDPFFLTAGLFDGDAILDN
jgi:hypothetical protein